MCVQYWNDSMKAHKRNGCVILEASIHIHLFIYCTVHLTIEIYFAE